MSAPFSLQNLSLDEYAQNPSLRTVNSFFLGGAFLLALIYITKSAAIQSLKDSFGSLFYQRTNPSNPESLEADADEKERLRRWVEDVLLGPAESLDPKNLVFILGIFVANASLSMFGSTLIFSQGQDLMCTFLVAWSGLSAEMIRVVGFIRLSLELRSLHSHQWEMYLTWVYMVAVIAFMLLNNAVESGLLRSPAGMSDIYLCYRQHSLWTSLLSSLFNAVFELYAITRLVFLLAPSFLKAQHRWVALKDVRVGMAVSLLLMEILTVVPGAIPVSIAADCIPFAVAAIIVLVIFNREQCLAATTLSRVDSIPSTRMADIERRDYDAGSPTICTPHTARSRSIIQRRNSSASRQRRYSRRSQLPPFPLGAITMDNAGQQKNGLKDLVINITRASPTTLTLTPRSSSGGSFRLSGSYETTMHSQVMVAQRAVRPWPSVPMQTPVTHKLPQEQQRQQKATRSTSVRFSRIPPPPAAPPPVPPKGSATKPPSEEGMEPRRYSEHNIRTATSSVVYGSDIIRGKRVYDPTRNVADVDDQRRRSIASTYISPSNGKERWSDASGWPRIDVDNNAVSPHHTGTSSRRDYPTHSARPSTRRRKDTFGAKSRRSEATYMSDHVDANRRSSFDYAAPMPSFAREYDEPESPSTAPVSRMSIVPVVPAAILSPPLVNRNVGSGAMATGLASSGGDATNSTRVRFGARPMRSTLLADGFREPEEDGMPRGLLSNRRGE